MWGSLDAQEAGLEDAFEPLKRRSREYDRAWSIAELRLSQSDVDWLSSWFNSLTPRNSSNWLQSVIFTQMGFPEICSHREMFGALLLTLGAEICRRKSPEGSVWPAIRAILPQDHSLHDHLFLSNGQPTQLTKEMITEAAMALNLRNAMDLEGTQQWFVTVKLQYGFTCRGAARRLAEWLVGLNPPHAIQYLNGELWPTELLSESFQSLWGCLKQYRKGHIDSWEAKEILLHSPWILEDSIDGLLKEARARIETLGVDDYAGAEAPDEISLGDVECQPIRNISLDWPANGTPRIQIELDEETIGGEIIGATPPEIDFYIDDQRICRWLLQGDGSYVGNRMIYAELDKYRQQPNLRPRRLTVRTASGDILFDWDFAESGIENDVLIFDLNKGGLIPAGEQRLQPNWECALICDTDTTIEGLTPIEEFVSRGKGKKALRLPSPIPASFRIKYRDFVLWQPIGQQKEEKPIEPVVLQTPSERDDSVFLLNQSCLLVATGIPPEAKDVELLIGKKTCRITRQNNGWITEREIRLSPELMAKAKRVRLRFVENGRSRTVSPKLSFKVKGIALLTANRDDPKSQPKFECFKEDSILNRAGGEGRLRVWIPEDGSIVNVLEGDYRVGRTRKGVIKLQDFPALGGDVSLQGENLWPLHIRCCDTGCLGDFLQPIQASPAQLRLIRQIPMDPANHRLVVWFADDRGKSHLEILPTDALLPSSRPYRWEFTLSQEKVLGIAATWRGSWLGSWWSLEAIMSYRPRPSCSFFSALKWLKIPLLDPVIESDISRVIFNSPMPFLRAWLKYEGLPDSLTPHDYEPDRYTLIRHFFWNSFPSSDSREAVRFLKQGAQGNNDAESWATTFLRIGDCSLPLLWCAMSQCNNKDALDIALRSLLNLESGFDPLDPQEINTLRKRISHLKWQLKEKGLPFTYLETLARKIITSFFSRDCSLTEEDEADLSFLSETIIGRKYFKSILILSKQIPRDMICRMLEPDSGEE